MEAVNYKNHIICYNGYNYQVNKSLNEFIESKKYIDFLDKMPIPIVMVLGGDGAMLRAIHNYQEKGYTFFGVNFGRKGFLLNAKNYLENDFEYIVRNYPLIKIQTKINDISKVDYAMNEIDIRAGVGKMIGLELSLKNNQKIEIEGDGLIISTPAGSTGYNSSLGGPIMPHKLESFVITPKAPWKPKFQMPIIINNSEEIFITNTGRKNLIEIYCDGRLFLNTEKNSEIDIKIEKYSKGVDIVILKNYLEIWDNKVLQEQGFIT